VPVTVQTEFEEMNGGCLRAEMRERKENSPEALSNFRAVVFSGSELRYGASPIAEKQAEVALPVVLAGLESSPSYQKCLSKLGQRILNHL